MNEHTTQVGNYIVDNILNGVKQLSARADRDAEADKRIAESAQSNETIRQRQIARARAESGRLRPGCIGLCRSLRRDDHGRRCVDPRPGR